MAYNPDSVNQQQFVLMSPRYKARLQCDANGDLTVSFPANTFASGVIPVISSEVECPASEAANYQYLVAIVSPPTATSVVFKVTRSLKTPIVSILGALNLFVTPGANKAWVHVIALEPS